jgi:glycosyltransferase involved in cell wall biosynthesis
MPLLSIITINFNNSEGLKKTIESVISQSFNDFEYIIIDGGSTDGSAEIIKQNNRINYWISEKDKGIYDAMNKGILKSSGNYLLFLNSGDYLCENVLEKVFSEIHTEDILYGNMKINWGGNNITDGIMPNKITLEHMVKDTLWHPVSFIKKELFNKFGLYNTDYEIVADYDFFFKNIIVNKSSNVHLNCFITEYNVEGFSSLPSNKVKEKAERLKVIKTYLSDEELKNINYLFVEKKETLFMRVFKRFKKIIESNGYKS